jgi:D-3-phosphoglycerate dehydrogenase
VEEATRLGIIVANTPEAVADDVAEHTIGLLLAVLHQIALHDRDVRNGIWDPRRLRPGWHLAGRTLGLVAFGHIARLVAQKMSGFGASLLAHDPYVDAKEMVRLGVRPATLADVLSQSDFVSVHCPLTKETHHLIAERELRSMKPTAVLINTSRGGTVDEAALFRALTNGWIAAAGLDVLDPEPPAPDNPLFQLPNVVITPHIAAYTDRYFANAWRDSVQVVLDLAHRRWPRWYVNHGVKPRWTLS